MKKKTDQMLFYTFCQSITKISFMVLIHIMLILVFMYTQYMFFKAKHQKNTIKVSQKTITSAMTSYEYVFFRFH